MNDSELPHESQGSQAAQARPADQAAQPTHSAGIAQPQKSRPRTGPIVWGCIFLAVCAFVLQHEFAPQAVNPSVWIAATAIGLGVILLVVAVTVVVRNLTGRAGEGTP